MSSFSIAMFALGAAFFWLGTNLVLSGIASTLKEISRKLDKS